MLIVFVEYFLNGIDPNSCETGLYIHVCVFSFSLQQSDAYTKQAMMIVM